MELRAEAPHTSGFPLAPGSSRRGNAGSLRSLEGLGMTEGGGWEPSPFLGSAHAHSHAPWIPAPQTQGRLRPIRGTLTVFIMGSGVRRCASGGCRPCPVPSSRGRSTRRGRSSRALTTARRSLRPGRPVRAPAPPQGRPLHRLRLRGRGLRAPALPQWRPGASSRPKSAKVPSPIPFALTPS